MLDQHYWQFLRMLERYGEAQIITQGEHHYYALFPGKSLRTWDKRVLVNLRAKGFIRPKHGDPEHLVLTRWGQWRIDCRGLWLDLERTA